MNDTLQCHRGEMYTAVSRKVGRLKSVKTVHYNPERYCEKIFHQVTVL